MAHRSASHYSAGSNSLRRMIVHTLYYTCTNLIERYLTVQ